MAVASSFRSYRPWRLPVTWPQSLKALLRAELAPTSRRYWVSLRLAGVATLGVGLVAICHVDSELGAYLVWLVVGAGPMMAAATAAEILVAEALVLAASVVMARALAESP